MFHFCQGRKKSKRFFTMEFSDTDNEYLNDKDDIWVFSENIRLRDNCKVTDEIVWGSIDVYIVKHKEYETWNFLGIGKEPSNELRPYKDVYNRIIYRDFFKVPLIYSNIFEKTRDYYISKYPKLSENYDTWISAFFDIFHKFHNTPNEEKAKELFHDFSGLCLEKYKINECDQMWERQRNKFNLSDIPPAPLVFDAVAVGLEERGDDAPADLVVISSSGYEAKKPKMEVVNEGDSTSAGDEDPVAKKPKMEVVNEGASTSAGDEAPVAKKPKMEVVNEGASTSAGGGRKRGRKAEKPRRMMPERTEGTRSRWRTVEEEIAYLQSTEHPVCDWNPFARYCRAVVWECHGESYHMQNMAISLLKRRMERRAVRMFRYGWKDVEGRGDDVFTLDDLGRMREMMEWRAPGESDSDANYEDTDENSQ